MLVASVGADSWMSRVWFVGRRAVRNRTRVLDCGEQGEANGVCLEGNGRGIGENGDLEKGIRV